MAVHALLKKALTLRARLRVAEIPLTGQTIFTDTHDIHITILELRCITKLLDTIPLGMNGILAIPTPATATAQTIGSDTKNLATMHKHSKMKTGTVALSQPSGIWILQKTIEQGIMPLPSGLNTGRHILH
jgi:hypothetical protein